MIRFRMVRINVDQFAILTDRFPENGGLSFSVTPGFAYSVEGHRVASRLEISFKKDGANLLVMVLVCEFEIHPDDWGGVCDGESITIPKEVLELLTAQTVGTARGVMYCKTEGTPFNAFILPPINVTEIITDGISERIKTACE